MKSTAAPLDKRPARVRAQLRARLKEGAIKRDRDREIAAEWDPLADEVWQRDIRR